MLILNSGGTFNKRYNKIRGNLEVPFDNIVIETILDSFEDKYSLAGLIYKDSLDFESEDRKTIANIIKESEESVFILIHGTDTMHLTAEFLDEILTNKLVLITGAMKPFEIDKIEATLNLGIAIGFAKASRDKGVYICMNGYVEKFNNISKNIDLGKFDIVN